MNTEKQLSSNVSITDFMPNVRAFLAEKGIVATDKDIVKGFFEGKNYTLVVYDARHQQNNLLITFFDFVEQEDLLIELNQIFRNETQHTSMYHILKFARQNTDEVLGMLPTFRAFFGSESEVVPTFKQQRMSSFLVSQTPPIAA